MALASNLLGKTIGKWLIIEKRNKDQEDNSGYFSTCYNVRNEEGELAFLKAFNYQYAFGPGRLSADTLKEMTENYIYERDLLKFCEENRMRRVVSAIDNGEYREPDEAMPVPYLVFEIAQGNFKSDKFISNPSLSWKLKSFHGALVGLSQLHSKKIAHQDIKPSNILIFGGNYSKISDLGNATQLGNESNWDNGDLRYAPIELLYRYCSNDWETRRFGADFFMMGGLLFFMITQINLLALMIHKLPENKKPECFGGKFEEIKPYLLKVHSESLAEISESIPELIRDELMIILAELSNPIPDNRGNPQKLIRRHKQFSLERYISIIDRLSNYIK